MARGVLFDIDGTLVDSNYATVLAWADAFASLGYNVPMVTVHHLVGQGAERLVENALGHLDEAAIEAHDDFYAPRLHSLHPFDQAAALLRKAESEGLTVVLATSASKRDATFLRAALDADDVIDHATTSDDAESSKPEPDLIRAALDATGLRPEDCVFVGDTVWDVKAAKRAGMDCVCVLTGGIAEADLLEAGAVAVYSSVADLLSGFDESPLGALTRRRPHRRPQ
jgi:HAD superfamily hydrolase (TIGR01509 family)